MTTGHETGPAILTPDQKLRVFVSSTLAELADERAAVSRAITSLHLSPVMFELGARPHPPQELYRAYLAQSDIFIGLYWQSYGWIGPNMEISGLEDEFRLAGSRPKLLYLKAPAPDRHQRLSEMIAEIQNDGTVAYRTFTSSRELGRLVRDDLAVLLSERFAESTRRTSASESAGVAPIPRDQRSIPLTSTSLIGRDADIVAVATLLQSADVRLVTLTGPGGMGKTRLAIAVGETLEETATRVLFIPLATIVDPALVLPRIAAAAGAIVEGTRSARDALIEHFDEHPTLLVLDNLEQVIGVASELDDLLSCCPVKILATSRTVLRLRAEHEYAVPPLSIPAAVVDLPLGEIAALPAVRLFVERAGAVRRDFTLTAENAGHIAEICRRLDGVPLAIELAAARTRLIRPGALLARLETVLDALGTGPVDLPERQRTLRATVEWSVGLLGEPERRLLATLSVFADGWTIDAAAAVAADGEGRTLDLLDELAGHSLVSVDATEFEPRFRMLTSVRELATEQLMVTPERIDVEARHADYFAALVETDGLPAERRTAWADRMRVEEENIRAAIRWFFDHDVQRLPHMLRSLWLFWQLHDHMPEGRAWVSELQRRTDLLTLDDTTRAEVLFTAAVTAAEVGDDSGALAAVDGIRPLVAGIADPGLQNALQLALSWCLPINGDLDGALDAALAAHSGFSAHHDSFAAFAALTVGMLETTLGHDDVARRYLLEVVDLGSRYGNSWLTSSGRTQLVPIEVHAGDHEAARRLIRDVLASIDDAHVGTLTTCFTLVAFAQLAVAESRLEAAATALGAVDGLRARAGLLAWPNARHGESELRARLAASIDSEQLESAQAAGRQLSERDALALVGAGLDAAPSPASSSG